MIVWTNANLLQVQRKGAMFKVEYVCMMGYDAVVLWRGLYMTVPLESLYATKDKEELDIAVMQSHSKKIEFRRPNVGRIVGWEGYNV